jgi:hypothetical protein
MRSSQARRVSTTNKVNLDFGQAVPALHARLVSALTALF